LPPDAESPPQCQRWGGRILKALRINLATATPRGVVVHPWYTIFVRSWYFFPDQSNRTYAGQKKETTTMKLRSIFGAAYAAIAIATAIPAAAHGVGETVTPHFQQTIPNTQASR
jgi:hypothetical protein